MEMALCKLKFLKYSKAARLTSAFVLQDGAGIGKSFWVSLLTKLCLQAGHCSCKKKQENGSVAIGRFWDSIR